MSSPTAEQKGGRFRDRVAIVTGAGSGIGREVALGLAREGATVVATDIDAGRLESLASEADRITGQPGDIADPTTSHRLVDVALSSGGRLDILANVAGVFTSAPVQSIEPERWQRDFDVNVNAIFHLTQAASKVLLTQRSGAVLNVASMAGLYAVPSASSYVASKHAVIGLTRALAVDWARFGVRVNALCPGPTVSDMSREFAERHPDRHARRLARIPLGRASEPVEQARTALFLLSDDAGFITGQTLGVDGGGEAMHSGYDLPAG